MQEAPIPCLHCPLLTQELPLLAVTVVDVRDAKKCLFVRSSQIAGTCMVFLDSVWDERISESLGMHWKSLLLYIFLLLLVFHFMMSSLKPDISLSTTECFALVSWSCLMWSHLRVFIVRLELSENYTWNVLIQWSFESMKVISLFLISGIWNIVKRLA